ncbi:hypothetical protein GJ744_005422 [Endocarpon pusillum]|uniref:Mitochondrial import receptor subunit tom22 n=1 Tax=Endocarpon pusillum TaxID=364733 RepID=A0A8H7A5P9_9EURO|nr:hypothetical protein GJ744_005422 [Endocarpon pusillum]
MVKLKEVEDEHFAEKPATTKDDALLESDNDDDYTDTDSEISVASDLDVPTSESLLDRVAALVDIIPPSARGKISSTSSSIASFTGSALSFTGKSLWVVSTSVLLLGIPYALAFGQEQEIMEREREEGLMREGASSMLQAGEAGAPGVTAPQGGQGGRPSL